MTTAISAVPVCKTITVQASIQDAFEVFTQEMDTWWPKTHHIGKGPMVGMVMEPRVGGRCYSTHEDGSEADWGRVLAWDPPRRIMFTWQIRNDWSYEPDPAKSSEVEVRFQAVGGETTRVELDHRFFDRQPDGGEAMRTAVDAPTGWTIVLSQFADRAKARADKSRTKE